MLQSQETRGFTLLTPEQALLDAHLGPLRAEIDACLASGRTRMVLDLGAVAFIDSLGLELLLDAARRLRAAGGRLKLVNPNPLCSEILAATRLGAEIEIFYDLNQAGRSFR